VLDHDSGEMNGDVLMGRFEGRTLRTLSLAELLVLLGEARHDEDSVQVLTAYLDRYHGDRWRDEAASQDAHGRSGGAPKNGTMSREEAYEVLGLAPGADAVAVKAAHHRLMSKIHPDLGGSTYLAAKINQAKDVLLGA
jgi:DnaJ-domain-containing protein 1